MDGNGERSFCENSIFFIYLFIFFWGGGRVVGVSGLGGGGLRVGVNGEVKLL